MTTPVLPESDNQPFFAIQRIFLKGTSLELPIGAKTFLEQSAPSLNLNLQTEAVSLVDDAFECVIRATLSAEVEGRTLFLLEVEQAGVFSARNLTAEQLADVQDVSAPTILAPYLRAQLADTLTRATLPTFYMPEINWAHMAHQKRAAQLPASTAIH